MNSYKLGSDITIVFKPMLRIGRKIIKPSAARGYVVTDAGKEIDEVIASVDKEEVVTIIPGGLFTSTGGYKAIFQIEYPGYGTRPHSVDFKVTPSIEGKTRQRKKQESIV
jgi:hypothetical protein